MTNQELYEKMKGIDNCIIYSKGEGFISDGIMLAQDLICPDRYGKKSEYSHVVRKRNGLIYESTLDATNNGVIKTDFEKRFSIDKIKEYKKILIQYNFTEMTEADWIKMDEYSEKCIKEKTKYGVLPLIGTLWILAKYKFWKMIGKTDRALAVFKDNNPFKGKSIYCIDFAYDQFQFAGKLYFDFDGNPQTDDSDISIVDDGIWGIKLKCETIVDDIE